MDKSYILELVTLVAHILGYTVHGHKNGEAMLDTLALGRGDYPFIPDGLANKDHKQLHYSLSSGWGWEVALLHEATHMLQFHGMPSFHTLKSIQSWVIFRARAQAPGVSYYHDAPREVGASICNCGHGQVIVKILEWIAQGNSIPQTREEISLVLGCEILCPGDEEMIRILKKARANRANPLWMAALSLFM